MCSQTSQNAYKIGAGISTNLTVEIKAEIQRILAEIRKESQDQNESLLSLVIRRIYTIENFFKLCGKTTVKTHVEHNTEIKREKNIYMNVYPL